MNDKNNGPDFRSTTVFKSANCIRSQRHIPTPKKYAGSVNPLYHKQSALGYALLVYMTIVVAVVTLIPFEFDVPPHLQISFTGNASDIFTNILLFIPLGFFFQLAHGHGGWKPLLMALCFGTAVSCAVEAGQLFLPSRCSSLIDVATNGFGAWLGAAIAACQHVRVRQNRMPGLFGLELPLLTSVYLLVPLMWLGGISLGGEIHRLGLMMLVGLFGGCVLASAYVNRIGRNRGWGGLAVAGYAAGWFLIGAVPAMAAFPLAILMSTVFIGITAGLSCRIWAKIAKSDRRFELPTLKRLLPIYGAYLLLLSVWPTTVPLGEWSQRTDFLNLTEMQRILFVSRFIEVIAAFTLLGYLVAEMGGRKDESASNSLRRVFGYVLAFAILGTTLRNLFSEPLFYLVEAVLFTAAAMYGAIIYRLQLAAVRRMQ